MFPIITSSSPQLMHFSLLSRHNNRLGGREKYVQGTCKLREEQIDGERDGLFFPLSFDEQKIKERKEEKWKLDLYTLYTTVVFYYQIYCYTLSLCKSPCGCSHRHCCPPPCLRQKNSRVVVKCISRCSFRLMPKKMPQMQSK